MWLYFKSNFLLKALGISNYLAWLWEIEEMCFNSVAGFLVVIFQGIQQAIMMLTLMGTYIQNLLWESWNLSLSLLIRNLWKTLFISTALVELSFPLHLNQLIAFLVLILNSQIYRSLHFLHPWTSNCRHNVWP